MANVAILQIHVNKGILATLLIYLTSDIALTTLFINLLL